MTITKNRRNTILIHWTNWINQQNFLQDLSVENQTLLKDFWLKELECEMQLQNEINKSNYERFENKQ